MLSEDDFSYALENTKVIRNPEKRIDTFSSSFINYTLITEDMDQVRLSKVREGSIQAEKPEIISPDHFSKLLLDGFGEKANQFAESISRFGNQWALLKYGFKVSKSDFRVYEVNEPIDLLAPRLLDEIEARNDPMSAVLTGVDDGWEVCLLKFMLDLSAASGGQNLRDFRDQGLI
ncbi:MAG: hypothetical protein AAFY98_06795 [Verrucomicrobiota bacterium]